MKGQVMFGLSIPLMLVLAVVAFFVWKRYAH